jgi:GTPase SAR1 family protein
MSTNTENTIENTVKQVRKLYSLLSLSLYGREFMAEVVTVSAMAGTPLLLLGEPGVGKTTIIENFAKYTNNSKYFYVLLTPEVTPSQIFGPVNIPELQKGILSYNTEGYLPSANVIFIDEIYKGGHLANQLLDIMQFKRFKNGNSFQYIEWKLFVGASNEPPIDDQLMALHDRWGAIMNVKSIFNESNSDIPPRHVNPTKLSLFIQNSNFEEKINIDFEAIRNAITSMQFPDIMFNNVNERRYIAGLKLAGAYSLLFSTPINEYIIDLVTLLLIRDIDKKEEAEKEFIQKYYNSSKMLDDVNGLIEEAITLYHSNNNNLVKTWISNAKKTLNFLKSDGSMPARHLWFRLLPYYSLIMSL